MKENNDRKSLGHCPNFGQLRIIFCAAFLACAPASVVFADFHPAARDSHGDLQIESQQAEVLAAEMQPDTGVPVSTGELDDSVVPAQNEEVLQYLVSASFSPADMVPGQNVSRNGEGRDHAGDAGDLAVAGDRQLKLPYALVLALLAIIGLVPVSRRSH